MRDLKGLSQKDSDDYWLGPDRGRPLTGCYHKWPSAEKMSARKAALDRYVEKFECDRKDVTIQQMIDAGFYKE